MEDKPVGQPMNFGDAAFFQQELHNQGISSIIVSDETLGKSNEAIHLSYSGLCNLLARSFAIVTQRMQMQSRKK